MRVRSMVARMLGAVACTCAASTFAWAQGPTPGAVELLLKTLDAPGATEQPIVYKDDKGNVVYLGAPQGGSFRVDSAQKAGGSAPGAQAFFETNRAAFGIAQGAQIVTQRVQEHKGNSFVRLRQSIGGVPVYGAETVMQLNGDGDVLSVNNDMARDLSAVESGAVSLKPGVSAAAAGNAARQYVDSLYDKVSYAQISLVGSPVLSVLVPSVVGLNGPSRLIWVVNVVAQQPELVAEEVFVDAGSGETVFHYSKANDARSRRIFDFANSTVEPASPVRVEGDAPYNQVDVDVAYDYLGDVYDYYFVHHGRDSYDDAGAPLAGYARYPFANAAWFPTLQKIIIGTGFGADDVVAHEMTHAVTSYTSNLAYFGFSGAMNESMSDIFGEFVDLTNGKGDDQAAARWWLGEDVYDPAYLVKVSPEEVSTNAIRYMKDPTVFGDPDRLFSPNTFDPTSFFDSGGVHINSGIGNKLCYLMTDGDNFNGRTVRGMGIEKVSDLFYATQFLLPEFSTYYDWYFALGAAATQLGLSFDDRLNIKSATQAVEIEPLALNETAASLQSFRAEPTRKTTGEPVIALSWINPSVEVLTEITLVRNASRFPLGPTDGTILTSGKAEKFLDEDNIQEGVTYYYAIFAELTSGYPQIGYAKATAGATATPPAIQAFGPTAGPQGTASLVDLAFSQLTFTPVGPWTGKPGTPVVGASYESYDVSYAPGVTELPVQRDDADGGAISIPLTDDELVTFSLGSDAIPFFGQLYSEIGISSNGYITFLRGDLATVSLTPSLADALSTPRISFLYTDLNPAISGQIWAKFNSKGITLTFDSIPQFRTDTLPIGNTVQVQIAWSGEIKITYGQLATDPAFPMSVVCGLSDGNGVAVDPAELFPDDHLQSVDFSVDLTDAPPAPTHLSFTPQGRLAGDAGERFQFTARTQVPAGAAGTPVLFAEWNGPGVVPFADNGDGTGIFNWQSTPVNSGVYTVRVEANLNGQKAYQDVRIITLDTILYPTATNLTISTGTPFEDPSQSRFVADDKPLIAGYKYVSPLPSDATYDEGSSFVFWMRNGQIVTALLNARQVPSSLTQPGDQWYFRLVPITESFIEGEVVASPVVTIAGYANITNVTPNYGSVHGGEQVRITGTRMRGVLEVTFGGISAAGIRAISDTEIEVTTPVHLPGTVPIAIRTANGTGSLLNAFTFLGEGQEFPHSDVNADGRTDATDIQLVINAVLQYKGYKGKVNGDINQDGAVNSSDIQAVVNSALFRN